VLTLETLAQLQALSFRNAASMGKGTTAVYNVLREHFTVYDNSRIFHDDLVKFRKLLFSSQVFDDLAKYY
jgi:histidine ammonia-lyase